MHRDVMAALADVLSNHLLGYNFQEGNNPETFKIEYLCEVVDDYLSREIEHEDMIQAFRDVNITGFDVDQFILMCVERGMIDAIED